jgi:hypothetical protein
LKRTVILSLLLCGLASFIGCGKKYSAPPPNTVLPHRALISNLTGSRIDIADTSRDRVVTAMSGDLPGRLLLSNDKKFTVSLSPIDNSVNLFLNARQSGIGAANLAGASESIVLTVDNGLLLGAVPTEAGPVGQAPGAVDVVTVTISANNGSTSATMMRQPSIFLPGARFLAASPNTNALVAMSDSVPNPANPGGPLGRVWTIQTSLVNSNTQPYVEVVSPLWDHPVFALGSTDNSSAYVLNCGAECGGTQASIVQFTFPTKTNPVPIVSNPLPIPGGATVAFRNGNILYVAGTTGLAGMLTTVDLVTLTITGSYAIADGYHDHVMLGANNLLFVGARGCTVTRDTSDPTMGRGCLTLFDTVKLTPTILPPTPFPPPATDPGKDDVTGMTPIANRSEVYVIEAAELMIYDTTTGRAKVLNNPPKIVGQGVDVVAVDF